MMCYAGVVALRKQATRLLALGTVTEFVRLQGAITLKSKKDRGCGPTNHVTWLDAVQHAP